MTDPALRCRHCLRAASSRRRLGIAPGVRVGVIVTNGPELAVLLVALLSTASVVPINSAGELTHPNTQPLKS